MYLGMALVVLIGTMLFDYRKWRTHPWLTVLAFLGIFCLLWCVFGFKPVNGSYRWIALGPLRLQPSEFAKLIIVITTAVWMDRIGWRVELFKQGAFYPTVFIGALAAPIILEPDFGSTIVLAATGFLVMFVAGTRVLHMLPLVLCGFVGIAVKIAMNPNRVRRLAAFFDSDISTASTTAIDAAAHQGAMSLVAIRNGGIWGVGLGESMQKHLYLPEAHTDFIFAVGAEELGILFSIAVVVLFLLFFFLSVYIARKAVDRLGRLLVVGMSFIIFFQAMFNLGVVCEALPTKGMALPFFSYGGTNLLSSFFAVGTILSVGIHSLPKAKRRISAKVFLR